MKKSFLSGLFAVILLLTGCSIDKNHTEREPVRIVKINDALYYEIDEDAHSHSIDKSAAVTFEKAVDGYEIPQNNNESNFSDGNICYPTDVENFVAVLVDDDYELFKKIALSDEKVGKFKYAVRLDGEVEDSTNHIEDVEYIVLCNSKEITIDDAAKSVFDKKAAENVHIISAKYDD